MLYACIVGKFPRFRCGHCRNHVSVLCVCMHCGKFSAISLRPLPLSVSSFVGFCLHEQAVGLLVRLPAGVEHVFIIYVSLSALNKFFLFVLNHVLKEILKEKVLLCSSASCVMCTTNFRFCFGSTGPGPTAPVR